MAANRREHSSGSSIHKRQPGAKQRMRVTVVMMRTPFLSQLSTTDDVNVSGVQIMVSQDPVDICSLYVVRASGLFWKQNAYLQHLLTGSLTGTESTGTGPGSSHTPRRRRKTEIIDTDSTEDDSEEPTPGPSQTKKKKKGESKQGRGICWKATPLTPNLTEYHHQDETDLDRHCWTPLDDFEQYIDRDLMKIISECSNVMSLSKSGDPFNMMRFNEVYHFFGACILMSCIRYPTIRMYWSKALRITAITERFTRPRFFKLRVAIKVVIDDDVPEDLRRMDKFWKVRPFLDCILQGCKSLTRPDCASIDEQMIPFTGACPFRQYLPMKPNPVGIKNFVCASANGIVLDFELYQGTKSLVEKVEVPEGLGLGSLVIERLCQTLQRGTKVYCDRFFTTINGAQ
ncbi:PiggyBac transposable element-derived protein 3 [Collichthys lucidus]|uniref:PiggyBac transposable element-derived protein 3 n=1 Tax=Collichthys lucidus TaxID=240159 RepID=A0A4U5ULT1_COLLU|nr:PiggyBac transposable element-derived protein 3 [Collichthys lucidus]